MITDFAFACVAARHASLATTAGPASVPCISPNSVTLPGKTMASAPRIGGPHSTDGPDDADAAIGIGSGSRVAAPSCVLAHAQTSRTATMPGRVRCIGTLHRTGRAGARATSYDP